MSFALLEDWDKGDDLKKVSQDFIHVRHLGFDTVRCSFGWDDYEPSPGQYDFRWLRQFVQLADRYGITLRPYIGYTPKWAGAKGEDELDWNNPPADLRRFREFVRRMAHELEPFDNVASFEIYNEVNAPFWWDGSTDQYAETLKAGSEAVKRENPDAEVILAGFVYPDAAWLGPIVEEGFSRYYDITAFHAYPETWTEPGVTVENYLSGEYREKFVPINEKGGSQPIWINEMGFATTQGTSEKDQANWFARAISTFLADPHIEHIGVYELKDLRTDSEVLGDEKNYYLGLLRRDGTPKLAYHTVDLINDLLNVGELKVTTAGAKISTAGGEIGELYYHVFERPDKAQVVFIWDKAASPSVTIRLPREGKRVTSFALDGRAMPVGAFDGSMIRDVQLTKGQVTILRIDR